MNEELRLNIYEFMKRERLGVISTIDSDTNRPESAVVAFAEKENLELIFGTFTKSRKYKNIQSNPNVSFVIGWTDEFGTIQYEGTARELSGEESQQHASILSAKNANSKAFELKPGHAYFLVTPTWIRWVDKTQFPQEVHEMSV